MVFEGENSRVTNVFCSEVNGVWVLEVKVRGYGVMDMLQGEVSSRLGGYCCRFGSIPWGN